MMATANISLIPILKNFTVLSPAQGHLCYRYFCRRASRYLY
jgi:hypothetical protein